MRLADIRIGMAVRLIKPINAQGLQENPTWCPSMDAFLGKKFTVKCIVDAYVKLQNDTYGYSYHPKWLIPWDELTLDSCAEGMLVRIKQPSPTWNAEGANPCWMTEMDYLNGRIATIHSKTPGGFIELVNTNYIFHPSWLTQINPDEVTMAEKEDKKIVAKDALTGVKKSYLWEMVIERKPEYVELWCKAPKLETIFRSWANGKTVAGENTQNEAFEGLKLFNIERLPHMQSVPAFGWTQPAMIDGVFNIRYLFVEGLGSDQGISIKFKQPMSVAMMKDMYRAAKDVSMIILGEFARPATIRGSVVEE